MDHLVCFVPAMLALGSHMGAVTGAKAESYMQLAVNLTETCWQFYHTQPTGGCAPFTSHRGKCMSGTFVAVSPHTMEHSLTIDKPHMACMAFAHECAFTATKLT